MRFEQEYKLFQEALKATSPGRWSHKGEHVRKLIFTSCDDAFCMICHAICDTKCVVPQRV